MDRRLSLLKNPGAGGPSWSAGILARKMLVERSGFCGLESAFQLIFQQARLDACSISLRSYCDSGESVTTGGDRNQASFYIRSRG